MSLQHHEILPNLRRATHVKHWWQNQVGDTRSREPENDVLYYNGLPVNTSDTIFGSSKKLCDEILERNAQDIWTEMVEISMSNGHRLTYRGERAQKIWSAWRGIVYQSK